jgi:predicted extracellular nuclease
MMQSIKSLLFIVIVSIATNSFGQKSNTNELVVAFYNVENLFDTLDTPDKLDEEFTPEGRRKWGSERYNNKVKNLAKVISSMNEGNAPDVLGLCEVENKQVVDDLVAAKALAKYNYQVVHRESKDWRGIDVALIYKESVFSFERAYTYYVPMPDSISPTRDILVVEGSIHEKPISFFVNHFPSRSEGLEKSRPKRIEAAKVLRHAIDSVLAVNPKSNILAMGDFNDEPADSSLHKVVKAKKPITNTEAWHNTDLTYEAMINLMFPLKEKGKGSYKYRKYWNMLDQILVNSSLFIGRDGIQVAENSTGIYAEDWMKQKTPKYFGSPLRTFGGRKYLAGYSDHFPVYTKLKIVNNR